MSLDLRLSISVMGRTDKKWYPLQGSVLSHGGHEHSYTGGQAKCILTADCKSSILAKGREKNINARQELKTLPLDLESTA